MRKDKEKIGPSAEPDWDNVVNNLYRHATVSESFVAEFRRRLQFLYESAQGTSRHIDM